MVMQILQQIEEGDSDMAAVWAIQASKCLAQVAIDGGNWDNGLLLLPEEDGLSAKPAFGGTEAEMRHVHSYRRGIKELKDGKGSIPFDKTDNKDKIIDPDGKGGKAGGKGQKGQTGK